MNKFSFVMMCAIFCLSAALPSSNCVGKSESECNADTNCIYATGDYNRCISRNNFAMDVMFVLDSSSSISHAVFEKEKEFVEESIKLLDGGDATSQFGITVFNQLGRVKYALADGYQNAIDAAANVEYYANSADSTNTKYTLNAIRAALDELQNEKGSSNHKSIVVLLTDNAPDGPIGSCLSVEIEAGRAETALCDACDGNRMAQDTQMMSERVVSEKVNVVTVYLNRDASFDTNHVSCLRDDSNETMKMSISSNEMNNGSTFADKIAQFVDSLSYYEMNGRSRRRLLRLLNGNE